MRKTTRTRFNEVESVVVAFRHFLDKGQDCVRALRALEPLAFWIMHQIKKVRTERCFSILSKLDTFNSTLGVDLAKVLELEGQEKADISKLLKADDKTNGDAKSTKNYKVELRDIVLAHLRSSEDAARNMWGLPAVTLASNAPSDDADIETMTTTPLVAVLPPDFREAQQASSRANATCMNTTIASTQKVSKANKEHPNREQQPLARPSSSTAIVADPSSVVISVEEDSKPPAVSTGASSASDQGDHGMAAPPVKKQKIEAKID